MLKICGFNVANRKDFKLVTSSKNHLRDYYESTNLKNHIVRIFPKDKYYSTPMKFIYNKSGKVLFASDGKNVVMFTENKSIILVAAGKLIKKVTDIITKF